MCWAGGVPVTTGAAPWNCNGQLRPSASTVALVLLNAPVSENARDGRAVAYSSKPSDRDEPALVWMNTLVPSAGSDRFAWICRFV